MQPTITGIDCKVDKGKSASLDSHQAGTYRWFLQHELTKSLFLLPKNTTHTGQGFNLDHLAQTPTTRLRVKCTNHQTMAPPTGIHCRVVLSKFFVGLSKFIDYTPDFILQLLHTLSPFSWATFLGTAVNTKAPCRLKSRVCDIGIYRNLTRKYYADLEQCEQHATCLEFTGI